MSASLSVTPELTETELAKVRVFGFDKPEQSALVGYEINRGTKFAHVMRIFDGGVVESRTRGFASTLYYSAICHGVKGGAYRVGDVGGSLSGAESIHANRLRQLLLFPILGLEDNSWWTECRTCFETYRKERSVVSR